MVLSGMQKTEPRQVNVTKPKKDSKSEKPERKEIGGYEMILGRGTDSRKARNEWAEAVEKLLEEESFERAQQHSRKNFQNASVHNEPPFDTP